MTNYYQKLLIFLFNKNRVYLLSTMYYIIPKNILILMLLFCENYFICNIHVFIYIFYLKWYGLSIF